MDLGALHACLVMEVQGHVFYTTVGVPWQSSKQVFLDVQYPSQQEEFAIPTPLLQGIVEFL